MDNKKIQHLQILRQTLERKLRVLEVQEATFGVRVSPDIIIEMENTKEKIAEIDVELSKRTLSRLTGNVSHWSKIISKSLIFAIIIVIVVTFSLPSTPYAGDKSTSNVSSVVIEQTGAPGSSANIDWMAVFMMDIEPNGWSLGEHHYSITVDCPPPYGKRTDQVKFKVSSEAKLLSNPLYLRRKGIFDERFVENTSVEVIHPLQKTIVSVVFTRLTQLEAQRRSTDCKVTVEWDNGSQIPIPPLDPGGSPGGHGGGG